MPARRAATTGTSAPPWAASSASFSDVLAALQNRGGSTLDNSLDHSLVDSLDHSTGSPIASVDPGFGSPSAAPVSGGATSFVATALEETGKRYVFGASASPTDPNPAAFDCSELVQWAAERKGVE